MQKSLTKCTISAEAAQLLLDAAAAKAAEMGKPMVIAVTDEAGVLKAFRRMDGAPQLSVDIAINKAYTSIAFGMPTHAWHEFIKDDDPLRLGIVKTDRLIVFGGGFPVKADGEVIGGIGVSGGHWTEDMDIAQAALDALERAM
ncbi:GlcG/HbpS family heme-binding protein [Novosphingobium sp. B 225]|uniref:GlcG/HbpS family heme-binding protein n=1 Tax=Novosphingobium sp. B 225 TaxID=1961849 RepID=UPI000B4B9659|nr:heme-binding protein [Novosphingobium sp. B 225]